MTTETPLPPASSTPHPQFASAYRVLQDAIAAHAFPGCAFGVLSGDTIMLEDALGRFTYDEAAPAVESHTIYDVASLTKVVTTTAAAMLLNQNGLLDLNMPIGELLPGFVVGREPGTFARHVEVRHLLAHSSGLPGVVEFFRNQTTPAALFRACLELPIEAAPGSRANYSDPGFILLGKALEVVQRESLPRWVKRHVYEPLGMRATGFNPPEAVRAFIPPTEKDTTWRRRIIQGEVQDENAWVLQGAAGHAGLFSSAPDLLRFARAILASADRDAETVKTDRLFSSATIERFAERQGPEGSSRALGWDTPSANSSSGRHFSPRSIGHLGFSGCSLWIDLEARVAVALLTNRTWPDRKSQQIKDVRPAFHDAIREALSPDPDSSVGTLAD
jgi:CubicO group peptidase (beta-lactamase class C family)